MGLCVFSLPTPLVMIERIYILYLSNIVKSIGSLNFYPLFRVRSWNNGVRCMSFYILSYKVCTEITYQLSKFNFEAVEVCELTRNFIPYFSWQVVTYPYWDFSKSMLVIRALYNVQRGVMYRGDVKYVKFFSISSTDQTLELTNHLSHISQYTIQNRTWHISVLNGAFWDKGRCIVGIERFVYCTITESIPRRCPRVKI